MKRITGLVLSSVVLLTLVLALAGVRPASADTLCVGVAPCAYTTVQDAIAGATSGDTINVQAGTYTMPSQVFITKNLTIVGADKATTILKSSFDTTNSGDGKGWFVVNPGFTFNLSNVTLDGTGHKIFQGIRDYGTGTINNVYFTHIEYNPSGGDYAGTAVVAFGGPGMNVNVTNSTFDNIGREGVLFYGAGQTGTFSGNTYTGKGAGNWLDYAVEVGAGANVNITNNVVTNCTGVATVDGSTSAGIIVTTFYGPGSTATITGNTLTNNYEGIGVGYDASDTSSVVAHFNNITSNTHDGISSTARPIDASNNWWGSPAGPGANGNNGVVGPGVITTGPLLTVNYEVGDTVTMDTTLTVTGLYGVQLVVNHNNTVLNFTGGVKHTPGGWIWDILQEEFTNPYPDTTHLSGSEKSPDAAVNLTGQSLATWNYQCIAPGTSQISYDMTPGLGTVLSDSTGLPLTATLTGLNVTCSQKTVTVHGLIGLEGRLSTSASPAGWNGAVVTLTCTNSDCAGYGPYVFTATVASGAYSWTKTSVGNGVAKGNYTATVTRRGYLNATKSITVGTSDLTLTTPTLLGGDVNGDQSVSESDLTAVGGAFGTTITADTGPDINGDGYVNILDLVLVGSNYGSSTSVW